MTFLIGALRFRDTAPLCPRLTLVASTRTVCILVIATIL